MAQWVHRRHGKWEPKWDLIPVDEGYYDEEVAEIQEMAEAMAEERHSRLYATATSAAQSPVPSPISSDGEADSASARPTVAPTPTWSETSTPRPSAAPRAEPAQAADVEPYKRPAPIRPTTRGRSNNMSKDEISVLRSEQVHAVLTDRPWRARGPEEDAPFWRGQRLRQGYMGGAKRYAKRGGRNLAYYEQLNREGRLLPTSTGAIRVGKGEALEAITHMKGTMKGGKKEDMGIGMRGPKGKGRGKQ